MPHHPPAIPPDLVQAFLAGYDAGWGDTGEGHNGEYTSPGFTPALYESAKHEALAAYTRTAQTGRPAWEAEVRRLVEVYGAAYHEDVSNDHDADEWRSERDRIAKDAAERALLAFLGVGVEPASPTPSDARVHRGDLDAGGEPSYSEQAHRDRSEGGDG